MRIRCVVMENGRGIRIIIVLIGTISEILEYKIISAFYSQHNSEIWLQCSRCDPASYSVIPPLDIWDSFPCPPEGEPELLLDLDWTGRLGEKDGETVLQRVAERCSVILPSSLGPRSGLTESTLFIANCDINCILVVLAVFVCSIVLLVPAVLCCFKRQYVCKWIQKKSVIRSSLDGEPPIYGDSLYPPLSSSVTRDSEIIYNSDGAQTRLLQPELQQKVSPYRYYERVFSDKDTLTTDVDNDINQHLQKNSSEETSLTYSGTDTTHTYESLKGSQRSSSFRLSNISGTSAQNPDDQYNYSIASSGRGQYTCACPRCSRKNVYRPYESIDYTTAYNVYPQKPSNSFNRYQQYRIPSPSVGAVSDNETEALHKQHKMLSSPSSEAMYIEEPAPPERVKRNNSFHGNKIDEVANTFVQYPRQNCNCRKCSQVNLHSNMASPTNFSDSEFYGVPYQMSINMVPLQPCNCRNCSQNDLNRVMYNGANRSYRPQNTCNCRRCLQDLQALSQNKEPYSYDPNEIKKIQRKRDKSSSKKDNGKKEKNNSDRPLSTHASSSDAYTGSEKSYRSRIPKTNGSLYRSKINKS